MTLDFVTKVTYFPSTLGHSVGYGQITLCDAVVFVYNLNKKTSGDGLYLSLPSHKNKDGKEKNLVIPTSGEIYEYLFSEVLKAKKLLEESRSQTQSQQTIETSGKRSFASNSSVSGLSDSDSSMMVDI